MTFPAPHHKRRERFIVVIALLAALFGASFRATYAQIIEDYVEQKRTASKLYDKGDYVSAASILEMLARSNPDDIEVIEKLTFSLYATTATIKDPKQRGEVRARVKVYLNKARELGDNSKLLKVVEDGLSVDDPNSNPFSAHKEAEAAMREGEDAFVHGEYDKAIKAYTKALASDPRLDMAAIFTGDVYFKKGMGASDASAKKELLETSGKWFAKAISINENRETAYRYWGDALMALGKMHEASDKFIDAIIADPGSRQAYIGLGQWAQQNQASISHPEIEPPAPSVPASGADVKSPGVGDAAGHVATHTAEYYWSLYERTRAEWKAKTFNKEYPHEKAYRHSLKEEAAALASVAELVIRDQKDGKALELDASLKSTTNLYKDGLIEAFVLFNRVDSGVAQDYAAYRILHRDKLHRYWADYVVGGKR